MRTKRESSFRQPLDEILGTVSCVRVLRELTLHGEPLSASDLADRTSLSRPSAGDALRRLVGSGLIATVGTGRYVTYRLHESHFLAEALQRLYRRERERQEGVFEALREIAGRADPDPVAVWIYGSVARGSDRPESDLDIVVIASSRTDRPALEDVFRDALLDLEEDWDLPSCSVVLLTEEEVRKGVEQGKEFFENLSDDAVPVYGQLRSEVLAGG